MQTSSLSKEDKKILITEINKSLISLGLTGIILSIVLTGGILWLDENATSEYSYTFKCMLVIGIIIYLAFIYILLSAKLLDYISGRKTIVSGIINEKKQINQKSFYISLNNKNLVLKDYYFSVGNYIIPVDRTVFNNYKEGDQILLSFTKRSNILMSVTSEKLQD